jgi:hypothetical protein
VRVGKKIVEIEFYRSSHDGDIVSHDKADAPVIEWADSMANVWDLVRSRSKTFGSEAVTWHGYERGNEPARVIARAGKFKQIWEDPAAYDHWTARHALAHFGEKGFTSSYFQQRDDKYTRLCRYIDHTPETLQEAIRFFVKYCSEPMFPEIGRPLWKTDHILVNGVRYEVPT